jgi:peptidoglycan hydrolase-like protein with peptidoglycan-binding domain
MHMKTWRSVLALMAAGTMLAGTAFAQSSGSGDTAPKTGTEKSMPGGTSKPGDSGAPAASPGTGGTDATKPDAARPETKSDAAQPEKKMGGGKGDRAARGGDREQVKAVQQALKDKGHDPGPVDGVIGPKTQAALKDFQKSQGLQETGRLDAETTAKLGMEGKTGAAEPSSPAASPKTGPGASGTTPGSETGKEGAATKDKK